MLIKAVILFTTIMIVVGCGAGGTSFQQPAPVMKPASEVTK